ncbi:hypothetical protein LMH87_003578 [Akanthomyces muscarius]|uniref:Major facilitator superfamily (MFS) profile domain-containing protein n=1 Tax=Akanthomyces muscarius TaxID=2231603 RepID=A0A9W8UH23_AKAMU|nr:hypothetical protein LMH87_003578 [Akanthomyces muscarius]KAJ4144705.1 hypothetical protein LMH87_003578 [Akanthomyces muscarius]
MAGRGRDRSSQGPPAEMPNGDASETTPLLRASSTEHLRERGELPFSKLMLVLSTSFFGVFLAALDSSSIATLSAPIASEFRSLSLLSWLATAYLIANAACQPITGRLTDIFGRRAGIVASSLLFALGSLLCGLAPNAGTIVLGRAVVGVGGGGLICIPMFLTSDLTPLRRRGVLQGIGNLWYSAGAMLGGVFGGLLHDRTRMGWRLAFLMQVPPALLLIPAVWVLVKVPPKQSDKSYLARVDYPGAFFTCSFLVLLLLGLNTGGTLVPWSHPLPLTTLPLSVVCFVGFIWWESKATQPIIPVRLFRNRTILSNCFGSLFISMVLLIATYYAPLYLQVRGDSAAAAGVKLLWLPLGGSIGSLATGYAMAWTGKYVRLGIFGSLILIAGTILFALQSEVTSSYLTCVALVLVGGGFSVVSTTVAVASIAAADHSQQAVITSAIFLARSVGAMLGITSVSAAYQNILKSRLLDRFGDEQEALEEIGRILDSLEEINHLPEGWKDGVMVSFMEAFDAVWYTTIGAAVLALACICLVQQHELHSRLDRR